MALALFTAGIRIQMLVESQYQIAIILSVLTLAGIMLIIYTLCMKKCMQKGKIGKKERVLKWSSYVISGAAGMSIAKNVTKSMDDKSILQFLAGCIFFLASIILLGTFNLYKYHLISNNKELLKELNLY